MYFLRSTSKQHRHHSSSKGDTDQGTNTNSVTNSDTSERASEISGDDGKSCGQSNSNKLTKNAYILKRLGLWVDEKKDVEAKKRTTRERDELHYDVTTSMSHGKDDQKQNAHSNTGESSELHCQCSRITNCVSVKASPTADKRSRHKNQLVVTPEVCEVESVSINSSEEIRVSVSMDFEEQKPDEDGEEGTDLEVVLEKADEIIPFIKNQFETRHSSPINVLGYIENGGTQNIQDLEILQHGSVHHEKHSKNSNRQLQSPSHASKIKNITQDKGETHLFRAPLPLKAHLSSSTHGPADSNHPPLGTPKTPINTWVPFDSPHVGKFLSHVHSQELPQLHLTPNLGLGTPRYGMEPTSAASSNIHSLDRGLFEEARTPLKQHDRYEHLLHSSPDIAGFSPSLPCTPLMHQYEASLGVSIEAISTPYLAKTISGDEGPDLLEMIDDDKETVQSLEKSINICEGNLTMQEQMRYVKGERNVDHCNSEAQSAAMYPDSMNHIKQQTNSQRRYSKVISHDLAEALKAQQRRRQQARKKEIQESASLRGVMEEKIVRKITAAGRRTRSMSATSQRQSVSEFQSVPCQRE